MLNVQFQKLVTKFREIDTLPKNTKANMKKVELQQLMYQFENRAILDLSYSDIKKWVNKFRGFGKLAKNTKANLKKGELQKLLFPFAGEILYERIAELQRSKDETLFDSNLHHVSKRIKKEKGKNVTSLSW